MRRVLFLGAWTLAVLAPPALAQVTSDTLLQVKHLLDWESVSDPQISPDGSQILYTRRWADKMEDRWQSEIWIMNADGSRNRALIEGSNARWSRDGTRILYLAEGEPKGTQIWVRWMDAEGATSQITRVEESPRNPQWSPGGKSIAFVSFVPSEKRWKIDMPPAPEGAKWTKPPRVIEELHYRYDRRGFTERGFLHLFVVTAEGGTPRQITSGEWTVGAAGEGPPRSASFDWTPDGAALVFEGLKDESWDLLYDRSHIYRVEVATGAIRQLTTQEGYWTDPAVSPDGRLVAFSGYGATGDTYALARLWVIGMDGSGLRQVAPDLDRPTYGVQWAPDSRRIYFTTMDQGTRNVRYASLDGDVRAVTEGMQTVSLSSFARDRNLTAVGVRADPDEPADIVRFSLRRGGQLTKLTDVNGDILANKRIGELEELWYTSSGGARVQGWLVKPPSFDPSRKYPMIMEIHGGPFAMYDVDFDLRYQIFAANGYVVLYTNPRGSIGYGEQFSKAIDFRYPGVDYDDLMAGVDAAIVRGFIDTTEMYVGGCSGGGVLSSWVIGHTDRFAAAAVRCPVINWMSMAGQTDIPYFTHSFFRQPFWENPDRWLEQSPLMYVQNVTTPTLVMTGELDLRTPMPQSEEYYVALKMLGVPVRLLRFQKEYHGTSSKPSNYMRTLLYMMDWYGRWTRENGEAKEVNVAPEPVDLR
jgi:dipeptidyl aminopeptidase/acylaminoacyl peptidase